MGGRSAAALLLVLAALGLPPAAGTTTAAAQPASVAPTAAVAPTLAVWPRNDLVDGEYLLISVRGLVTRSFLSAELCAVGDDAYEDRCDYVATFDTGPRGNARLRRPADVIVDRPRDPVDCRVDACELQVIDVNAEDEPHRPFLRMPLTFDPAGPDPVPESVTVTPTTGLRDGDEVVVSGDGFPLAQGAPPAGDAPAPEGGGPVRPVYLYQCRAGDVSYLDCNIDSEYAGMDPNGRFTTRVTVHSRLYLGNGGTVDCLAEPCALVATSNGEHSEAGRMALTFDPAGPVADAPTVTVEPAEDVQDGEELTITGEHFPAGSYPSLALCPPGIEGWDLFVCHDIFDFRAVNAQGRITYHHAAHTRVNPNQGADTDCVAVECNWVITWGDVDEAPSAPQRFAPEVEAKQWRLTATPTSDLRDGQTIQVTGRGYDAADLTIVYQCVVGTRDLAIFRCDGFRRRVHVDPAATTSFRTTYNPTRTFVANTTRVNCARRICYLATRDDENGLVRGPRLTFRP